MVQFDSIPHVMVITFPLQIVIMNSLVQNIFLIAILFGLGSCKKAEQYGCTDPNAINYSVLAEEDDGTCTYESDIPKLIFKFKFDSTQIRYDSFGNVATVPAEHATQSPSYNAISGHYIEMIPSIWTALGAGEIVYEGENTSAGGAEAVDFSKASVVGENEEFHSVPIRGLTAGTYEYVRVSVTYQNYDIIYNALGFNGLNGTLASFVGFNTYLETLTVNQQDVVINDNKLQGYWAFESQGTMTEGQVPTGGITVVNPHFASSPIPPGSCLVTGEFETPLVITGNETEDITIIISVSTNQSFEWTDADGNGQYDPLSGDIPVDMGLRGLKALVE